MNRYCRHKVHRFYESYRNQSFDQDDVALFIVLTRDYSKPGSIFRELGDFLAHPDKKDRGLVLENVRTAASHFEENCRDYFRNKQIKIPAFTGIGSLGELSSDLVNIFEQAGLFLDEIEEKDDSFRDLVFCIIFLLNSFKIKLDHRLFELSVEYSHDLSLYLSYESVTFPRHFVTLPVIVLENVWLECPSLFGFTTINLSDHVARRFAEGFLGAISYADDVSKNVFEVADFEQGKVWPMPKRG